MISQDYHEVYNIIDDLLEGQERQSMLKKFIGLLFIIILALLGALLGISILANETTKESHVKGTAMTSRLGEAVRVDSVESNTGLFDLPAVETATLAKMKDLVFYADLSTKPGVGSWVEATYKIAGVYKPSNDVATLTMTSGETLTLKRSDKSGTINIGGASYPIADKCIGTCSVTGSSRRLRTDIAAAEPVQFTGPRGATSTPRGRGLGYFSALQTSGSFTMMQAGGF